MHWPKCFAVRHFLSILGADGSFSPHRNAMIPRRRTNQIIKDCFHDFTNGHRKEAEIWKHFSQVVRQQWGYVDFCRCVEVIRDSGLLGIFLSQCVSYNCWESLHPLYIWRKNQGFPVRFSATDFGIARRRSSTPTSVRLYGIPRSRLGTLLPSC